MCRSGMAVDAINPKTPKASKRSSKASSSAWTSRRPSKSFNAASSENEYSINNPPLSSSSTYNNLNDSSSATASPSNLSSNVNNSHSSLFNLHLPETHLIYDFSELCSATQNFRFSASSYSSTAASWRCTLRGRDVIVFQRRLRRVVDTPPRLIYHLMSIMCTSHHNSIVKLLGASVSSEDHMIYLVYDFVPGANLSDCLRNRVNPDFTPLSTWASRMQVATDLAHGLDYIHNFTRTTNSSGRRGFIHNRIKSSSIVVTEQSYEAKICHFGTAELCGEAATEERVYDNKLPSMDPQRLRRKNSNLNKLEGVRGYMSPEFLASGVGTQKSDVYALGVVILELLSGQEPVKFVADENGYYRSVSVIETAREAVGSGGVWRWLDRRLKDSYPMEVAEKVVRLGLDCVEDDPDRRPDMNRVTGLVSKMYLESKRWAEKFVLPQNISTSMAPR